METITTGSTTRQLRMENSVIAAAKTMHGSAVAVYVTINIRRPVHAKRKSTVQQLWTNQQTHYIDNTQGNEREGRVKLRKVGVRLIDWSIPLVN